MAAIQVNPASVWSGTKKTVCVLVKAAYFYLAFTFVAETVKFYAFCIFAAEQFYKVFSHLIPA